MNGINIGGIGDLNRPQQNNNPTALGGLTLSKGMSLNLEKFIDLKLVEFGLGWISKGRTRNEKFDLDATALILQSNNRVRDAQDVIFYNQLNTNRGVMSEGDDRIGSDVPGADCEVINVSLSQLPSYANKVKIVVTIDEASKKQQNFGMVSNAYIACRNKETGEELGRYMLSEEFAMDTAVEFGELVKTDRGWKFDATGIGLGANANLFSVLLSHGVQ